ncbi:hypothetical protein ACFSKW_12740 [Nonomuraea mangrovi]|uniref:Uncharacterized protein n=1 Tax=Nonomuraea mangrovi TaxID=2316207 RepID=A0ABW4SRX5_9ACTN
MPAVGDRARRRRASVPSHFLRSADDPVARNAPPATCARDPGVALGGRDRRPAKLTEGLRPPRPALVNESGATFLLHPCPKGVTGRRSGTAGSRPRR